jgi:uncharacterized protein YfaS (alpha-2-macroglobulin family)
MTLSLSGMPDRQGAEALYGNSISRSRLDTGSLADLGLALSRVDAQRSRTLASVIDSRAVVSATGAHWEDSAQAGWWSAPPIATTIEGVNMLLTLSPHDAFIPAAARWLILARQGPGWDCSHDTAQAIAALAAYARAAGEGKAAYSYRVTVDNATALAGSYGPTNQRFVSTTRIPVSRLHRSGPSAVVVGRQSPDGTLGSGPLYYVTRLHYYLPAQRIAPRSAGIDVARTYLNLKGRAISTIAAGSAVRVKVRIHTAHYLTYLHIDDPIPAGLEPIDESLNTSQQAIPQPGPSGQNGVQNLAWYLSHSDLRDDRVALDATWLPPGTYTYTYVAQATVAGHYSVAPTHAFETFFPEVFGRSAGQNVAIR